MTKPAYENSKMTLQEIKTLLNPIAEGTDNSDLRSEEREAVKILLAKLEASIDLNYKLYRAYAKEDWIFEEIKKLIGDSK